MDPSELLNHQDPIDLDWLHYFDSMCHECHFTSGEAYSTIFPELEEIQRCFDMPATMTAKEILDGFDQIPVQPLKLGLNYSSESGLYDFDIVSHECHVTSGDANGTTTAGDHGGRSSRTPVKMAAKEIPEGFDPNPVQPVQKDQNYSSESGLHDFDSIIHECRFTSGEANSATTAGDGGRSSRTPVTMAAKEIPEGFHPKPVQPLQQDQNLGLQDFDPIADLLSWDWWDDSLPLLSYNDNIVHECYVTSDEANSTTATSASAAGDRGGRRSRGVPELEEIQRCFDMPITMAAKELNVGLTVLKKRCRELNIKRWPHRKLRSLKSLIQNVKELGLRKEEIEMLEEQKKIMEKLPEMEITETIKKLRQACFKASYKRRRVLNINN